MMDEAEKFSYGLRNFSSVRQIPFCVKDFWGKCSVEYLTTVHWLWLLMSGIM